MSANDLNGGREPLFLETIPGQASQLTRADGTRLGAPVTATTTPDGGIGKVSAGSNFFPVASRTEPLRYATFGDSTANTGPANTDTSVVNAPFPASGNTAFSIAPHVTLLGSVYPKAYYVANGGISGETTTQMLARDSASAAATRKAVQDVCDLAPNVVMLRGGSINDLQAVTAATFDSTVASTYANHVELINRFLTNGVYVIDAGLFGYSAVAATDPAMTRAAIVKLNAMYKAYADTVSGVDFLSVVGSLTDEFANYYAGVSFDGIHLSVKGQSILAALEKRLIESVFGVAIGPRYAGINLAPNPQMVATNSPGYGTVANNVIVNATNSTRQNAKIEVIGGKRFQTCEFTPTGASAAASIALSFNPTTMSIAAGDKIGFEFDFLIQPLVGSAIPVPTTVLGRVALSKQGAGNIIIEGISTFSSIILPDGGMMGKCVFQPFVSQEASAAYATSGSMQLQLNNNDLLPVKLGAGGFRIVKI